MAEVTINDIRKEFGYETAAKFAADWRKLTAEDKAQIKEGLANGTMTY